MAIFLFFDQEKLHFVLSFLSGMSTNMAPKVQHVVADAGAFIRNAPLRVGLNQILVENFSVQAALFYFSESPYLDLNLSFLDLVQIKQLESRSRSSI